MRSALSGRRVYEAGFPVSRELNCAIRIARIGAAQERPAGEEAGPADGEPLGNPPSEPGDGADASHFFQPQGGVGGADVRPRRSTVSPTYGEELPRRVSWSPAGLPPLMIMICSPKSSDQWPFSSWALIVTGKMGPRHSIPHFVSILPLTHKTPYFILQPSKSDILSII
jgi:hypothetical protein